MWIPRASGTTDNILGVKFSSATDGWAIASASSGGERLTTTDGGLTWASTADTSLYELGAICFVDAQRAWVTGNNARILRTTNAGVSWQLQNTDSNTILTSIHFADANTGWAVGYYHAFIFVTPVIYKTQNGGNTWNLIYNPADVFDNWALTDVFCVDQNLVWAVGTQRLLRSTTGAGPWYKDTVNTTFYGVYFVSPSTGWTVGMNGTILKSTDGGISWAQQLFLGSASLMDVYFADSLNGWAAGQSGRIFRTTNGGTQWYMEPGNTTETLEHIFAGADGSIWIAGQNGILLQSGKMPALQASPMHLDFGSVLLGQFKDSTVIIRNTGLDTLVISEIASTDATFVPSTTAMTIAPGDSAAESIRFTPVSLGSTTAELRITSNTISGKDSIVLSGWSPLSQPTIIQYQISDQWNLISLTLRPDDPLKVTLFPTAVGPAFTYGSSYERWDTLKPGTGYWLKFSGSQQVMIAGTAILQETLAINKSWNLIGSLWSPVAATDIETIPPGLITSPVFKYVDGYYYLADTLQPGSGHWIKSSAPGLVILKKGPTAASKQARMILRGELPPLPRK
jgi:photosystem II stability/assembly factor-like uncharacterized protein